MSALSLGGLAGARGSAAGTRQVGQEAGCPLPGSLEEVCVADSKKAVGKGWGSGLPRNSLYVRRRASCVSATFPAFS